MMEISGSTRRERKIKVSGISEAEAIERFEYGLKVAFNSKRVEDKGQYVVLHHRIDLPERRSIHIVTYTSDIIFISGSPRILEKDFDEIANKYVIDEEMRRWFEENNIYAIEEIARRLFEAYERELWQADEETIEKLREAYSELEGILEDEVVGDVQGGTIDIYAMNDVENWSKNAKDVFEVWRKLK